MRKIAPLHADAQRVQEIIAELEKGVAPPVPVPQMRALMRERSRRLAADPPAVGEVENSIIVNDGCRVPVRIYHPLGAEGGRRPAYIHAHGGGFVVGDLDMADTVCSTICRDAGIGVISVD